MWLKLWVAKNGHAYAVAHSVSYTHICNLQSLANQAGATTWIEATD